VGPRAGLDAGARRKILFPCWGSNHDRPARSQTLYWLSYYGSLQFIHATSYIEPNYRDSFNVLFSKILKVHLTPSLQPHSLITSYDRTPIELLAILLRIREIPGSNLGSDTGYPEAFRGIPQCLQANTETAP
jgi:hypothetical protein